MIRWSYLAPRLVLLAVLWALLNFVVDPAVKRGLEYAGSSALGAKVEIGSLDTDIFPPGAGLRRVRAADPQDLMKNLVEFETLEVRLEGRPLLEKKIVGTSSLTGLRWGTDRETSGAWKAPPSSPAAKKLKAWAGSKAGYLKGIGEKKLSDAAGKLKVAPKDLSALKSAEKLEAEWKGKLKRMEDRIDALDAEKRIKEIERTFNKVKGSGNIARKLKAAKELTEQVKRLREEVKQARADFDKELGGLKGELDAVRKAKDGDLSALFAKLNLPSFDAESLSAYLLGPKAAALVSKALSLVETSRKKMPPKSEGGAPAEGSPVPAGGGSAASSGNAAAAKSGRGVTVSFPKEKSWPAFWLKRISIAGEADLGGPLPFSGEGADFTTEPSVLGKPAVVSLSGKQGTRTFTARAVLDHGASPPKDTLEFRANGLPVGEFKAGGGSSFSLTVTPGMATVEGTASVTDDALSGVIRFTEKNIKLRPGFGAGAVPMASALGSAFEGLDTLELEIRLSGSLRDPKLKLKSNLGEAAASGLKRSLGREVEKRKKAIRAQVDKLVEEKMKSLDGLAKGKGRLAGRLGGADSRLNGLQDRIKGELKAPAPKIKDLRRLFR